jgi:hypothetical protein
LEGTPGGAQSVLPCVLGAISRPAMEGGQDLVLQGESQSARAWVRTLGGKRLFNQSSKARTYLQDFYVEIPAYSTVFAHSTVAAVDDRGRHDGCSTFLVLS